MANQGMSMELAAMLERRRCLSERTLACRAPVRGVCGVARADRQFCPGGAPERTPESPPGSALCRIRASPPASVVVTRRTIPSHCCSPWAEQRHSAVPDICDAVACARPACKAQLAELRAEVSALRGQADRASAAQHEEATALRAERDKLAASADDWERRAQTLQNDIVSLRTQQEWATLAGQQKANLLQAEVTVLRRQLESVRASGQQKVDALRAERDAATETIEDLRSQVGKLRNEATKLRSQVEDLEQETQSLVMARHEAQATAEDLRKYVCQSQAEAAGLRGQLEDVAMAGKHRADRFRAERDAAVDAADRLRLSFGELRAEAGRLEAELAQERERSRRLEAQVGGSAMGDERTLPPSEATTLPGSEAGDAEGPGTGAEAAEAPAEARSSEGALRSALSRPAASAGDLRAAVGSVAALLEEAQRELRARELRERRAVYERLHAAVAAEDEEELGLAIAEAARAGVDAADVERAATKCQALAALTPVEREAKRRQKLLIEAKRGAFVCVRRGDADALAALLDGLDADMDTAIWRDHAGRSLSACAAQHGAAQVQALLAARAAAAAAAPCRPTLTTASTLASSSDLTTAPPSPQVESRSPPSSPRGAAPDVPVPSRAADVPRAARAAELPAAVMSGCFRAVVQDDAALLCTLLAEVPIEVWSSWRNKADKDLLSLSQERGAAAAYALLARLLGVIQERHHSELEDGEAVWVFVSGEVQPRRATVLEGGEDGVVVEYWDDASEATRVPRASIAKSG